MKMSMMMFMMVMCVNVSAFILQEPLNLTLVPTFNVTTEATKINASEAVDAWDWRENFFGDVGAGLNFMWNSFRPLLDGGALLILQLGVPTQLSSAIIFIYRIFIGLLVYEMISGRNITGV